jgi:hypothetical protein
MEHALQHFNNIHDPRSIRQQQHPVLMIIETTLLASLSGINSFSGFADFTEAHIAKLIPYFDLLNGALSYDT